MYSDCPVVQNGSFCIWIFFLIHSRRVVAHFYESCDSQQQHSICNMPDFKSGYTLL